MIEDKYEALLEAERILSAAFDDAHSIALERETGVQVPQSARNMVYSAKNYLSGQVRDAFAGRNQ
jgi:hypothetical protein